MTAPFTVKWEYTLDGVLRSRIIEADQVNVAYDNRVPLDRGRDHEEAKLGVYPVGRSGCVVLGNPSDGGESMSLTFGKVYVMNRDGRTIATYTLADPEGPQGSQTKNTAPEVSPEGGPAKSLAHLAQEAGLRKSASY